jgi:hypothetical protein
MPADTLTATWPTAAELHEVSATIDRAVQEIEELNLRPWANLSETPPSEQPAIPTTAELGSLSSFIAVVEQDLDSFQSYLEQIKRAHTEAALYVSFREADDA